MDVSESLQENNAYKLCELELSVWHQNWAYAQKKICVDAGMRAREILGNLGRLRSVLNPFTC